MVTRMGKEAGIRKRGKPAKHTKILAKIRVTFRARRERAVEVTEKNSCAVPWCMQQFPTEYNRTMEGSNRYVAERDGGYWIADSRVSLDSVVYAFLNGQSPESIAQSFPVLNLEQVYGAITHYLAHQAEVDAYLKRRRADFEAQRKASRQADPMFCQKLAEARKRQLSHQ